MDGDGDNDACGSVKPNAVVGATCMDLRGL